MNWIRFGRKVRRRQVRRTPWATTNPHNSKTRSAAKKRRAAHVAAQGNDRTPLDEKGSKKNDDLDKAIDENQDDRQLQFRTSDVRVSVCGCVGVVLVWSERQIEREGNSKRP